VDTVTSHRLHRVLLPTQTASIYEECQQYEL